MGYYKDTGSLQSMASAEAILKKRMPEKVGILPVAELLFVAESMWVGEHDMKGHFHPSFRFVKAKRYNAKPHVLIELDGETLADINGRSKYYEGFSRCVDRKPEDPYGSRDFQEFKEDSSSALKVLYCINQLNEAVHVKGIDAIVMVRPTKSPVIFQQQLGRALTSGGNRTPLVFDLCNNFGSLGGIAGMQERMERAYEKKSEQGEKPIYEPKDFHVIDEIKDPRELAEELREALNPSTTIDEKISFLEEIAAQNGGQL